MAGLPEFDTTKHLDSEAAIAAYLADILDAKDPALPASALGDIARARGMSEIANASGLTREALYKALRPNAKPRYDTIAKVCGALGVRLVQEELRKTLLKYKLHTDQDLFDRACAYIKQYY